MTGFESLGIFVLVFFATALGFQVPMAFSMGLTCLAMIFITGARPLTLTATAFSAMDSFPFLAIPFFVFAGALMQYTGISSSLVRFINAFVGRLRGSLGSLVVLASAAFGVLTGSTIATLSSIGKMMVPEMVKGGYKKPYAAALASASGFLGILIPPSVPGIFYALAAGLNISDVWISTIGPAFVFIIGYIAINYYVVGRFEKKVTEPFVFSKYVKNAGVQTRGALGALLMPIIIFGGIYGGVFTPTEAGAVAAVYGLIFFAVNKFRHTKMEKSLWYITVESAGITAVICVGAAFSQAGGRYLAMGGVSLALNQWVTANVSSPLMFLLLANIVFLILGMLIDINAAILIMTPLMLPTVLALGIDPIHFGAVMLVNLCVGYMTPPMAGGIFFICRLTDTSFSDVLRESWRFIAWGLVVVTVTTLWPRLSTFLVK
jgi:C4-dicarboxylate transporter DctM subunit